ERIVDNEVYEKYQPKKYVRTGHLKGRHGAAEEELNLSGDTKNYRFEINESSRDPVDGETWAEKARKVERGSAEMFGTVRPMPDRPFISNAIDDMKKIGTKHHN